MKTLPVKTSIATSTAPRQRSEKIFPLIHPHSDALPVVQNAAEIQENDSQLVRLQGQYIEVDARRRKTGAPQHIGFVTIILEDLSHVALLPRWEKDALRPTLEIFKYNKSKVEVVGIVYAEMPPDPQDSAIPLMACISDVQSLQPLCR